MKENKLNNATRWISFRVTEAEHKTIRFHFERSFHRKLSEYTRNVLLQKPVIVKYRDESADTFLSEVIAIKKELQAFGNNFNQVVKKLHTIDHDASIKVWVTKYDHIQQEFRIVVNELLQKINRIHEQWSPG